MARIRGSAFLAGSLLLALSGCFVPDDFEAVVRADPDGASLEVAGRLYEPQSRSAYVATGATVAMMPEFLQFLGEAAADFDEFSFTDQGDGSVDINARADLTESLKREGVAMPWLTIQRQVGVKEGRLEIYISAEANAEDLATLDLAPRGAFCVETAYPIASEDFGTLLTRRAADGGRTRYCVSGLLTVMAGHGIAFALPGAGEPDRLATSVSARGMGFGEAGDSEEFSILEMAESYPAVASAAPHADGDPEPGARASVDSAGVPAAPPLPEEPAPLAPAAAEPAPAMAPAADAVSPGDSIAAILARPARSETSPAPAPTLEELLERPVACSIAAELANGCGVVVVADAAPGSEEIGYTFYQVALTTDDGSYLAVRYRDAFGHIEDAGCTTVVDTYDSSLQVALVKGLAFGEIRAAAWLPGSAVPAVVDMVRESREAGVGVRDCPAQILRGETPDGVAVMDVTSATAGGTDRSTWLRGPAGALDAMPLAPMETLIGLQAAGRLQGFVEAAR